MATRTKATERTGRAHAVRLAEEGADVVAVDVCAPLPSVAHDSATPEDLVETVRQVEKTGRRIVSARLDVRDLDAPARRTPRPAAGAADRGVVGCDYRRSYRSRFMTLSQASTKSRTKRSFASSKEYTSAMPRRMEFEPKTRSAAVAVRTTVPRASRAS